MPVNPKSTHFIGWDLPIRPKERGDGGVSPLGFEGDAGKGPSYKKGLFPIGDSNFQNVGANQYDAMAVDRGRCT